jgi:hypothetical protein
VRAASIASATTLATGQLNKSDQLDVELHRPADLPAFILVKWPSALRVAGPDTFADLVAATFRILADARVTLSRMRGDRRTRKEGSRTC